MTDTSDDRTHPMDGMDDEDESQYASLGTVPLDNTATIDLYDRVDEILDTEIPDVEAAIEEAESVLSSGTNDEGEPLSPSEKREVRQTIDDLRQRAHVLEYNARLFHSCAEEWGGSEFTVKRNLGYHEVQAARDAISEMTVNSGQPVENAEAKDGAYKLKVLMFGIQDAPPDAPAVNADEFPWQVGGWLYDQFDAINSFGEVSAGNSSAGAESESAPNAETETR